MAIIADGGSIPPASTIKDNENFNNNQQKGVNMSNQVQQLQSRVGQLQDRVQILENDLKDTQEKVRHDMNRIVEMFQTFQKNQRMPTR